MGGKYKEGKSNKTACHLTLEKNDEKQTTWRNLKGQSNLMSFQP